MNRTQIAAFFRRDGYLLAAALLCVALCLGLGRGGGADTEEARISRVLSAMTGAGTVEVAISYQNAAPCGAVVVADGAGNVGVRLRLMDAVEALLGLDGSRVAVYERGGQKE